MMKAAVITEWGKPLQIQEMPIPRPGPNDILVKMVASGICHSDLHEARGEWGIKSTLPLILGHEGVGCIVEFGRDVCPEKYNLKLGDLIGIQLIQGSCLKCEFCLAGRETLCMTRTSSGIHKHGSFAEYGLMNVEFAAKLPDGLDPFKSAPLYCAGVTMHKALKVSHARTNDWISIVGVGGLGSIGIKFAKLMGFRVVGIVAENDHAAAKLAREMGADEVYDGPGDQHSAFVKEKTNGGVQAAIVSVPIISAYEQALSSLRQGGRLVMIALPSTKLSISIGECIGKQLEIVGSLVGTRNDLKETLDMAQKYHIECPVQMCRLEEINEVLNDMEHSRYTGRKVIDFT
ncbi:unnamed protein product [Adineta ricciae]|uniref:Alcohol dehydrogenase n=1 Tax=Adineta ricciae TaxID=249248 RepID=A0A815DRH3_ADIRI|nr:unnamed protein product [Adineta ricciae]CAF1301702.1 unnamed protein product [Adineta ricciae]